VIEGLLTRDATVYRETNVIYSGVPGMTESLSFDSVDDFYCDVGVFGVTSPVAITLVGTSDGDSISEVFSFAADQTNTGSVRFDTLSTMYTYPIGCTVVVEAMSSGGEPRKWRDLVGTMKVRYRERRTAYEIIQPGGRVGGRFKMYCGPNEDIQTQDIVVVDGITFRVESKPYVVYGLGGPSHKEMTLVVEEAT